MNPFNARGGITCAIINQADTINAFSQTPELCQHWDDMNPDRQSTGDHSASQFGAIEDAEFFGVRIEEFAREHRLDCAGVVIIPQEGLEAGTPSSYEVSKTPKLLKVAVQVNRQISDLYEKGLVERSRDAKKHFEHSERFKIVLPDGNFGTPIITLWAYGKDNASIERNLDTLCHFMLESIETSKKSKFHDVLSENLKYFGTRSVYENISESIKRGLFCDRVVVWKLSGAHLKAATTDGDGLDLNIGQSIAGLTALSGQNQKVADFDTFEPRSLVERIDWIDENELKSAILLPISGQKGTVGVAGVFYKRKNGATLIDITLCEYVISYFERLWSMGEELDKTKIQLRRLSELEENYIDIIKCLTSLHDLPSIHSGAASALQSLEVLVGDKNETSDLHLRSIEQALDLISDIVSPHRTTIHFGRKHYDELQKSGQIPTYKRNDLRSHVLREAEFFKIYFKENKIKINCDFIGIPKKIDFDSEDVGIIIRNLIQNSSRSLISKTHISRKINITASCSVSQSDNSVQEITLTVWDNGSGISSDNLPHIFEPEFTTQRSAGGKGLGLSIIDQICKKHGTKPEVRTQWGEYCEFKVRIFGYG